MSGTAKIIVDTDDAARLAVHTFGPAEGAPVLLLHGYSLDHTTWNLVRDGLVANGFRVIAPDGRGHGASTLGTGAPTAERLVADVAAIIDELALTEVHLVGHSLGAVVALAARVNPDVVPSLATVTSIAGTERSIQNPLMKLGAAIFGSRAGVWALGRQAIGRRLIASWFGASPDVAQLDAVRTLCAACPRPTRDAITAATADIDLRPTFGETGPPTFLLCGSKDMATPLKVSKRIAAAIPGAPLKVVDRAGHMVIMERPDVVIDQLTNWFSAD